MPNPASIRMGTTGKAQVKADFNEMADSGTASLVRLGDAGAAQAKRWTRAEEAAIRDIEAARTRLERARTKSALLGADLNPTKLDAFAGVNDNVGKSAASSAEVFEAAYRKMEQRAVALVAAIDPVFAAQQRFDREMTQAKTLFDAGALSAERFAQVERQLVTELNAVTVANVKGGNSTGALRAAMQGASYQVQDFFTQVSMGSNILQAAAVQGGQLAGQFANIEGKAGAVARFMIGPYGLAITAAALVLGPFIGKLINQNSALDEAIDKLKEDAKQTEITARAKEAFAKSVEGVEASIREQAAALDKAADSEKTAAQRAYDLARANLAAEISTRQRTAALLGQAIAQEQVDRVRATAPGQRGENATLSLDVSSNRVAGLKEQLTQQEKMIEQARRNLLGTGVALTAENARRDTDPIAAINARYKAKADAAEASARAAAKAGRDNRAALDAELKSIERNRAAAVKAEQDRQQAARQTANQIGRNVSLAEARQIAESIGGRVTSTVRSRAEQQRLYDKYVAYKNGTGPWAALAAKPGSSNHESGQALDIAKSGGVTLAKLISAYRQAGVSLSEALDEGSHYHIAFRKTGEAAKQAAQDRSDAAKKVREAAAAEKELQGDLREVVQAYDPARAAADDYASTLAKIDALVRGGKLTIEQGAGYAMAAYHEEQKRRADDGLKTFQSLFGSGDPMADAVDSALRNISTRVDQQADDDAAKVRVVSAALGELRGFGNDFVETVLDPNTWSSWGDAGRTIIGGLKSELIKLALLNPLKNLINGDKALPTLSSAIANIGKLFRPGANAAGTEYWSGGMSLVGENGPEIVSMSRGARVTPAAETRRMLTANDNVRGDTHVHVYANDAVLADTVRGWVAEGVQVASVRGAAGGAAMSQAEAGRSAARTLGRRWGR